MKRIFAFLRYIAFLTVLVFLYLFNRHPLSLILLITALLMPILSLALFFGSFRKVRFGIAFHEAALQRNEKTQLFLTALNVSLIPQFKAEYRYLLANDLNPNDTEHICELYIGPKESMRYPVPVTLLNSGNYHATLLDVTLWDLFGFVRRTIPVNSSSEVLVLPIEFGIDDTFDEFRGASSDEETHERDAKGNDPSEIFELRSYQSGDRPAQIHWKLSAKEQELMSKVFADMTGETFEIFLAQDFQDNSHMDAYFDILYSVGLHLCRRKIAFSFRYIPEGDSMPARIAVTEPEHVQDCLLTMYFIHPASQRRFDSSVLGDSGIPYTLLLTTNRGLSPGGQLLINKDDLAYLYLT